MKKKLFDGKIILTIAWFIFTFSLTSWWMILGFRHISVQRKMILWEGITLIICLFIAGVALIYYILRERKRNILLQEFFAAFNHELKTYMASLRLRAEGLSEDLKGSKEAKEAEKIVEDTVRLELQLENSLFLSNPAAGNLFYQDINLKNILESLNTNWPHTEISCGGNALLKADRRAMETILKNVIQNAVVHAKAKKILVTLSQENELITLNIENDGEAFKGEIANLSKLFYRHTKTSRSGVGLFLVKKLTLAMKGKVNYSITDSHHLQCQIQLPGSLI